VFASTSLLSQAFTRLARPNFVIQVNLSLTNTTVELLQGKAMVEADQVEKENHLTMLDHSATITVEKQGIYEFDADHPMVAVYDGKARVQADNRTRDAFKGDEVLLTQNPKLKTKGFNRHKEDELYAWSKLRSEYTSEANSSATQRIAAENPAWFYGMGWYWDPWFDSWAFVPGWGYGFGYSPFGFGFYSPGYWGGYYGFGHYGLGGFGGGAAGAFRGGGFRAGMGGFHGGGMGGRR
jgi:hypothetical protein